MNRFYPYYQPGPYPYAPMMSQYPMPPGPSFMGWNPGAYPTGNMAAMTGMGTMANMGSAMMGMNQASTFAQTGRGLNRLASVLRGFNYSTFLDGTQKTLTTINQIIPLVNQVTPMLRNASTMFRVANEVRKMSAAAPSSTVSTAEPVKETVIEPEVVSNPPRNPQQPTYF